MYLEFHSIYTFCSKLAQQEKSLRLAIDMLIKFSAGPCLASRYLSSFCAMFLVFSYLTIRDNFQRLNENNVARVA